MLMKDVIILLQIRRVYSIFWENEDVAKINGYTLDYLKKVNEMMKVVSILKSGQRPANIDQEIRSMAIKFLEEIENADSETAESCIRVLKGMFLSDVLR